jgi:hypothetical protein
MTKNIYAYKSCVVYYGWCYNYSATEVEGDYGVFRQLAYIEFSFLLLLLLSNAYLK